jgi:hypothetical protein
MDTLSFRIVGVAMFCWAADAYSAGAGEPETDLPGKEYHIYAGSTHAHTVYTWSHGEQFANSKTEQAEKEPGLTVSAEGVQSPPKSKVTRPDWRKHQGPPAEHFGWARTNGYDFYITTDHSQETAFAPRSPTNAAWLDTKGAARAATDGHFVALAGYEHSENNGPGGKGHLNIINSSEYLNALAPGIDLPFLYKWLKTVRPDGEGPVVASFNHPGATQYGDWAAADPEIKDIITLLEVINSNKNIHYAAFLAALDKGWKVSPVCGNDNHGFYGISHQTSRTFVLATNLTKLAILDAMRHRRTYASLAHQLQCRYFVNGEIMGSTLGRPTEFQFDIAISDPGAAKEDQKITRIDIVKDGGATVQTYSPTPAWSLRWRTVVNDATNRYFFVRVWNAGGGDAPGADPKKPVAWLAPVWTGR